jgi:methylenetetrahydrofolate reductase (NADPH)
VARIADLLAAGRTTSFEFMPPRTEQGWQNLRAALAELRELEPSFVSVTYGAGGSTRDRTREVVAELRADHNPMAHLTCWGHTRRELVDILERYRELGVTNILALRGDAPRNQPELGRGDLAHAIDLVHLTREVMGADASIGVAVHTQVHPESEDHETDRRHLAAKLAVADFGITQLFFRVDEYVALVDELAALGCHTPILPGIMPVTNIGQVERFAELSGYPLPDDLVARLHAVADDPDAVRRVGVEEATRLCRQLLDVGAPGLHYYTLNKSTATREIHAKLALTTR